MKMQLINPFMRYSSTFIYKPSGVEVVAADNHLIYVKDNSVSIKTDGKIFHLKKNDILYTVKGIPYEFFLSDCDENLPTFTSISFDLTYNECEDVAPRFPQKYTEDIKVDKETSLNQLLNENTFLKTPCLFKHAKQYYPYFSKISDEFQKQGEYSRDICSCFLKELIIKLHTFTESNNNSHLNTIEVVTDYISENYQKKLDNKFLANLVGFHPNYLGRLFKRTFKCGIQQYILDFRISAAKKLLVETQLPLTEISVLCGFEDYPYFSAYFKRKTGMNPSQYRIQHENII